MQKRNIMKIRSSVIMNRFRNEYLVMEPLSIEEEQLIDKSAEIEEEMYFVTKNGIRIPSKDIFLYGEVDVNNHADAELLRKTQIITQELNLAANIPNNFDYETGDVFSDNNGIFKRHDTWDKIKWFKFNHLLLGKPERIIIYRIHKKYVPRDRSLRSNNC